MLGVASEATGVCVSAMMFCVSVALAAAATG